MNSEQYYKIYGIKETIELLSKNSEEISKHNFIKILEQVAQILEELDERITETEKKQKKLKKQLDE